MGRCWLALAVFICLGYASSHAQHKASSPFNTIGDYHRKNVPPCKYVEECEGMDEDVDESNLVNLPKDSLKGYMPSVALPLKKIQIYPVKPEDGETYTEDFAVEGNINALYEDMMSAYVVYELMMAAFISSAAENVLRQNATTESLKKIDEMEEEKLMEERRAKREAEFKKVIDNFVKKSMY